MSDVSPLVIVGAGGLGREVAALVEAQNARRPRWTLWGFADDDADLHGSTVLGYPVLGDVDDLTGKDVFFVLAIGDGAARRRIAERLANAPAQPALLTHPSVSVHRTTDVAPGTILCNGAAPTVDVSIGPHVVVDQHCTVGHDSRLDAFVSLHPGVHVSGNAHLKSGVTMGAGSVVLPDTTIGAHATIGAGAVVTDDLPAGCTAVGVPARPLS